MLPPKCVQMEQILLYFAVWPFKWTAVHLPYAILEATCTMYMPDDGTHDDANDGRLLLLTHHAPLIT